MFIICLTYIKHMFLITIWLPYVYKYMLDICWTYVNFIFVFTHFLYPLGLFTQHVSHMSCIFENMPLNIFFYFWIHCWYKFSFWITLFNWLSCFYNTESFKNCINFAAPAIWWKKNRDKNTYHFYCCKYHIDKFVILLWMVLTHCSFNSFWKRNRECNTF